MEPRDGLNPIGSVGGGSGLVTLRDLPRPRTLNHYVESPPTDRLQVHKVVPKPGTPDALRTLERTQHLQHVQIQGNPTSVIVSQPKPSPKMPMGPMEIVPHEEDDSIICKHCQRCKCDKCREGRELPSAWLCKGKCLLSADNMVEKCTCLCAVKGCFYHLGKDYQQDNDVMCTDDPCACCSQPHCCKRWAFMSAMSLCLPCLCCYCPAKCAVKVCTACYNRCTNRGCQCASRSDYRGSQNKRLLPESESSSTT